MINTNKLNEKIYQSGIKKEVLASKLNLTSMALRNKMHNITEFKVSEVMRMSDMLNLTTLERELIFFAPDVDGVATVKKIVKNT